jgi:hypothetical protein
MSRTAVGGGMSSPPAFFGRSSTFGTPALMQPFGDRAP